MNILEIKSLNKQYGQLKALDNVDLDVTRGSVFGLLGPNGAGKTTLLRIINSILVKDSGSVKINGEDVSLATSHYLGYMPEERGRVGMPYREATLENILEERLLELVWEGWRRQDMVRFGVYHKSYDQRVQLADEKNGYTTVFPIPQKSIDLNPKLKQNVGYK